MRTWDENKTAINQLWPTHSWTEEEGKLVREDLSPLDQAMLYDAIRNTKRCHDTPFVHLKWILDEYRSLDLARKHASKPKRYSEEKLRLMIDDDENNLLVKDFLAYIDLAEPSQFEEIEQKVLHKLDRMHSASAVRVILYARARLLGQETQFSRVTKEGGLKEIAYTQSGWR